MDAVEKLKVERVIRFIKRTDGRDKLFRVLQYGSMVALLGMKDGSRMSETVNSLRYSMSTTRKALKLVRMLENVHALKGFVLKSRGALLGSAVRVLDAVASVLEIIYYFYDHLVWFHRVGIRTLSDKEHERVDKMSSYFWFANSIFDFLSAFVQLMELRKAPLELTCTSDDHDEKKREVIEGDRRRNLMVMKQTVAVVKLGADVVTAAAESNVLGLNSRQNRVVESLSGLLASVIGFHSIWQDVGTA